MSRQRPPKAGRFAVLTALQRFSDALHRIARRA